MIALFVVYRDDGILNGVGATSTFQETSDKYQRESEYNLGNLICFVKIVNAAGVLQYVAKFSVSALSLGGHFAIDKLTQMKTFKKSD